ncbi:hypothetical protein [Maribacter sp. 2210JD10-5]|uniref:hypothetical protein n=1 Tax=Maribacter sp. 2210JD10-5 TaxID=3386272 RepID=UPI0039BD71FD
MKVFLQCLVVCVLVVSCSKIEENNDAVIGIWKNEVKTATNTNKLVIDTEEWIFNDVYLGRFHGYKDGEVSFLNDFTWTLEDNVYTISYTGTDFPDEYVIMEKTENGTILKKVSGELFAKRQN